MSIAEKENSWKFSDTNNGFINQKNDTPDSESKSKSAVVQITRTGATKIMVLPKKKRPNKEKFLIALILALLMFCGMLVIMVFNKRSQTCTGELIYLSLSELISLSYLLLYVLVAFR